MATKRDGMTRRTLLRGIGAGGVLAAFPLIGCGGGSWIRVGDRTFDSGDLVVMGTANPGETPAELFARITAQLPDEGKLQGLVTWRQIEGDLAHLTTPDTDDTVFAADRFEFQGAENIGFFVTEFVGIGEPEDGQEFDTLRDRGPAGAEMVVVRDRAHYQPAPIGDRARDQDVVLYVRPEAANSGPRSVVQTA